MTVELTESGEDVELKAMAWTWIVLTELNQVQRTRVITRRLTTYSGADDGWPQ